MSDTDFTPTHHAGDACPVDMLAPHPALVRAYFLTDAEVSGDGPPYVVRCRGSDGPVMRVETVEGHEADLDAQGLTIINIEDAVAPCGAIVLGPERPTENLKIEALSTRGAA